MVWYGMVWYGMVWYGMVWYGMVWYGMVWYGMVCMYVCMGLWTRRPLPQWGGGEESGSRRSPDPEGSPPRGRRDVARDDPNLLRIVTESLEFQLKS